MLAPVKDLKDSEKILLNTTFLTKITDCVFKDLSSYYESVKDGAQSLLLCMVQRFLPPEISLS